MSQRKMVHTITAISIHREGDCPLLGDSVTTVELDTEGAGNYIVIKQTTPDSFQENEVRLEFEEIEEVVNVARLLLEQNRVQSSESD